jgi:prepilin-type N-terminal cleavage/methylation domain-containing protein
MSNHRRGFTLIEMMIALVIMGIIGLMAWRGLDGLIRGKERVESHSTQQRDVHYALTLLDRDCRLMATQDDLGVPPVALGNRSIWWVRHVSLTSLPGWQIVGYRAQAEGLTRMISPAFTSRNKAIEAWKATLAAPDSGYDPVDSQLLSKETIRQTVTVLSDAPNKTAPITGLKFIWQLIGNQAAYDRPITRVCLGGGF